MILSLFGVSKVSNSDLTLLFILTITSDTLVSSLAKTAVPSLTAIISSYFEPSSSDYDTVYLSV